jgi:hypothetical protein
MMVGFVAMALAFGAPQETPAAPTVPQAALDLANATKVSLIFTGEHVSGCRVTATSNRADIDEYVCDAAKTCGDKYPRNEDSREACLIERRNLLATKIAANKPIKTRRW